MFKVGDIVLEVTEKYKYLGVMFSEKGDFNLNATNLAKGGGRVRRGKTPRWGKTPTPFITSNMKFRQ